LTEFFRFPHIAHLAWLGLGMPRDDKVLSISERDYLLSGTVVIEEKIDGANLGISLDPDGKRRVQNRGQYLIEPFSGQFARLNAWLAHHDSLLADHLNHHLILFGEWCAAKHSLDYDTLPDWFLVFDVYDRRYRRFWSRRRRLELTTVLGLANVPLLFDGRTSLAAITALLNTSTSHYRAGTPEGLIIRKETTEWCESRAKLVRAEFTQTISEHWSHRTLEWNRTMRSDRNG